MAVWYVAPLAKLHLGFVLLICTRSGNLEDKFVRGRRMGKEWQAQYGSVYRIWSGDQAEVSVDFADAISPEFPGLIPFPAFARFTCCCWFRHH